MKTPYRVALIALCALAVLQIVWYGWWSPPTSISKLAAISFALVWFALPALGARHDAERGLLLGGLISLLYFSHGVMQAWVSAPDRIPALIEVALSVIVIAFAGLPSWQRAMARRQQRDL